jgi:hypothetical protein
MVPRTYGANISIGHQIKLKICAPFPRESAKKKANADIRRKNPQIDKSSFGRLAYLPKAEP